MNSEDRVRELETENAQLRAINADLTRLLDVEMRERNAQIADLTQKLQAMEQRLSAMNRRVFGSSSERFHDSGQQQLDLGGDEKVPFVVAAAAPEASAADPDEKKRKARRARKARIPAHVETVEHVIEVPESERIGEDGQPMARLGEETSERLHYIPSHFQRQRIVRPIYGKPYSDHQDRVIAPPPAFLVAKGLPTDELAIQVLIAKYADHLPLYRQSQIYARQDVHLPRSTLCGWVGAVCDRLVGVWNAIGDEVRSQRFLHLDDTPINVLAPTRCVIGRIWTYGIADAVHLRFSPSRAGRWPYDFLRGYRGYVVADAYAGHDALYVDGSRTAIGCWSHIRRKFEEIHQIEPAALDMLRRINALFRVESGLRKIGADEETVRACRAREAVPILDAMRPRLAQIALTATPQSPLGKAVAYAIGQWEACARYAYTGFLPMDNNLAERSLRAVAVGRKNYLFLGSGEDGGGDWAAIAYSIIGSCRLNGLDPYRYLVDIATLVTDRGFKDHAGITPRAVAKRKANSAA